MRCFPPAAARSMSVSRIPRRPRAATPPPDSTYQRPDERAIGAATRVQADSGRKPVRSVGAVIDVALTRQRHHQIIGGVGDEQFREVAGLRDCIARCGGKQAAGAYPRHTAPPRKRRRPLRKTHSTVAVVTLIVLMCVPRSISLMCLGRARAPAPGLSASERRLRG